MRTDRLLAEMLYLVQHPRVSARSLAERYEVSVRTIARDMEALCMAGVPVISFEGAGGGYALDEHYRIDQSIAKKADISLILTALSALSTVIRDPQLRYALEKYSALQAPPQKLHIDLSALTEDERVQQYLDTLRGAIERRHAVSFAYTNAEGVCATHTVEPMELHYRWYAWYLHAYSRSKDAVLTYKLLRMEDVTELAQPCGDHADAVSLPDDRPTAELVIRCTEAARVPLMEYLHARPQQRLENGDWLLRTTLPTGERFWRGALLSLGAQAQLLSPPELAEEMHRLAKEVSELYASQNADNTLS